VRSDDFVLDERDTGAHLQVKKEKMDGELCDRSCISGWTVPPSVAVRTVAAWDLH
jgi:hypothetical protein